MEVLLAARSISLAVQQDILFSILVDIHDEDVDRHAPAGDLRNGKGPGLGVLTRVIAPEDDGVRTFMFMAGSDQIQIAIGIEVVQF